MHLLVFSLISQLGAFAQYSGTASVSQGIATTKTANLYTCSGSRIAGVGSIKASDNTEWEVPAVVNYSNTSFPFASDLYNSCSGAFYANENTALAALSVTDIVTLDPDGEVITAYVFADNYFEMYINGIPVGKDKVPFTQFNSSIVRFKVKRPFTIAMLLVDWEENLGLGSEFNGGFAYHPGDGGVVAVFKDASNKIIAKTGADWKAQTFYTSPIVNLSCPSENGTRRLSTSCSTQDSNNGSSYYGLHWARPANVMQTDFDDSSWPAATTYTNAIIGVDNKPAYTNFTNIFDDPVNDAQFIWSTNVILDNEVIVRYTVPSASSLTSLESIHLPIKIVPNPAHGLIQIILPDDLLYTEISEISVYDILGKKVLHLDRHDEGIDINRLGRGMYVINIKIDKITVKRKIVIQ